MSLNSGKRHIESQSFPNSLLNSLAQLSIDMSETRKRGRKRKLASELDVLVQANGPHSTATQPHDCKDSISSCDVGQALIDPAPSPSTDRLQQLQGSVSLPTLVVLYQATKFVPHSFLCHRLSLITEIVKEVIPEIEITPEGLRQCVQLIDNLEPSQQLSLGPPPPNILWKATETTGFPHTHFLGPPCVSCLQCQGRLVVHNPPTAVIWYSRDGPLPAAKIVLWCRNCSIQYHPDMFGNKQAGFRFYNTVQPVVQCSQQAYIDRELCKLIAAAG